jgi:hypothetical protein
LSLLTASASGSKIQDSQELAQITVVLEKDKEYRLVASGPYDSSQSTGVYTIWQRTSFQPAKPHATVKRKAVKS